MNLCVAASMNRALLVAALSFAMGCGGKAVIDGGQGGAGGTSQSSTLQATTNNVTVTTTSTMPTSSTGMTTGCDCYCALAVACGIHGAAECPAICSGLDQEFTECACQNNSCDFGACSPGNVVVVSSSTGPGPNEGGLPWSEDCFDCLNVSQTVPSCQQAADACISDLNCSNKIDCHGQCNWTYQCNDNCEAQFPAGPLFQNFMDCAVCDSCTGACSEASVANDYCQ